MKSAVYSLRCTNYESVANHCKNGKVAFVQKQVFLQQVKNCLYFYTNRMCIAVLIHGYSWFLYFLFLILFPFFPLNPLKIVPTSSNPFHLRSILTLSSNIRLHTTTLILPNNYHLTITASIPPPLSAVS